MALSDSDVQKQIQHMMAFIEQVTIHMHGLGKKHKTTRTDFGITHDFRKQMKKPKRSMPRPKKSSTLRKAGWCSSRG